MLILTRRIGESVYIGEEIRMTVLGVRGTQVRLGINAPKDVPVHREEIYYKIKHEHDGQARRHYTPGGPGGPGGDGGRGNYAPPSRDFGSQEHYDDDWHAEEADPNNA